MEWAEETIARLRKLWDEGLSTAEIGRRLGVTKNCIVGKAHRLDLPARPSPIRRDGPPRVLAAPKPRTAGGRTLPPLASLAGLPKPQAPAKAYRPQSLRGYTRHAAPSPSVPDVPRPATSVLIEREPPPKYGRVVPCCFPIGDVKSRDFRFCGKPSKAGKPYCPDCCRRAYVPRRDAA